MARYLCPGRWQPLHDGHKALFDKLLGEGHEVIVAIRDTEISPNNSYSVAERIEMIREAYGDAVEIVVIPDFDVVGYGRRVGWGLREIHLDEKTEAISATAIRAASKLGEQT